MTATLSAKPRMIPKLCVIRMIDIANRSVLGYLRLSGGGMPQDIRVSPDGKVFYVAEMMKGIVYTIDPY